MIRAREIINIVESGSKDIFVDLVNEIKSKSKCSSLISIQAKITGSVYSIYAEFEVVKTVKSKLKTADAVTVLNGDTFKNSFKFISNILVKDLGDIKRSTRSRKIVNTFTNYGSSFGYGVSDKTDNIIVFFKFDKSLLDVYKAGGFKKGCFSLGVFWGNVFDCINEHRKGKLNPGEFKDKIDNIISVIKNKSYLDVKRGFFKDDIHLLHEYDIDKESLIDDFFSTIKEKSDAPLRSFEKLGKIEIKSNINLSDDKIIYIGKTITLIDFEIAFSVYVNRTPPVTLGVRGYPGINFLSLTDLQIDGIIGAVVDVLNNYNRVMNLVVNKPTKKTNTDW
jgi:hypothetical protein